MIRKYLLMSAAILAIGPLAACSATSTSTPRGPQVADLGFSQMVPFQLNVGAVEVVNNAQPAAASSIPQVSPAAALDRYARQRLQAVGGEGSLQFLIQQASLSARETTESAGSWPQAFTLANPMEYTVTMRVGLNLIGRSTQPNVRSAYTLERKKILPGGTSLADRDRELNLLVAEMVKSVDTAIEKGLSENMHLIVRPGPITFGQPAPIEPEPLPTVVSAPAL